MSEDYCMSCGKGKPAESVTCPHCNYSEAIACRHCDNWFYPETGNVDRVLCNDCLWYEFDDLKHIGLRPERCESEHGYTEKVFQQKWLDQCKRKRWLNHGYGTLDCLLGANLGLGRVTQRDAEVAATVIQWLGTNCGAAFLHECEREIKVKREQYYKQKEIERQAKILEHKLRGNNTALGFAILSMT